MMKLRVCVLLLLCMAFSCMFLPKADAYTFAYAGLYNRVEVTSVDDDKVERNVDVATEEFVSEIADPRKNIEAIDSTPDVTLQRYNEMKFQLQSGIQPVEFKEIDADYIIYGSVDFIATGNSKQGLIGLNGSSDTLRVDMSLKIIEKKTGKQVFTATGRGEEQMKGMSLGGARSKLVKYGANSFSLEAYHKAVEKAMLQMAEKIKKNI